MAIKKRSKSVIKNIRKAKRRYIANLAKKKKLKTALKKMKKAKSKAEAMKLYPKVESLIDKSVQDGIVRKKTAGRYKSRLLKFVDTQLKG